MRITVALRLAALVATPALILGCAAAPADVARQTKSAAVAVPSAMPRGITIQYIENVRPPTSIRSGLLVENVRNGLFENKGIPRVRAYADARGMTLYTYDKDLDGVSACLKECAAEMRPAIARDGAQGSGEWSIMRRADGSRQWALRGKPLYTSAKDHHIGEHEGDNENKDWHVARYEPEKSLAMLSEFTVTDAYDMSATVLADKRLAGQTLYGMAPADFRQEIEQDYTPVLAPRIGNPVGEFSVFTRKDGVVQWAYRGLLLFTFNGDFDSGSVKGGGADSKIQPVVLSTYFMPGNARHGTLRGRGTILTDRNGLTLYRRDTNSHARGQSGLARSEVGSPLVGASIGTKGCDSKCLETWIPFRASATDQPGGYWGIVDRDDGSRQWTYKGYALYSNKHDRKPGDVTGTDRFEMVMDRGDGRYVDPQIPALLMDSVAALTWAYAEP